MRVRGVDHIIEALVAAITARRMPGERLTAPPSDVRGLPTWIRSPADTEGTLLWTFGERAGGLRGRWAPTIYYR